jgi:hypothetical protein
VQVEEEDPYTKAWKDWVERDKQRGLEKARRMEKQEKLAKSWEMVKMCREIMKENYSNWQERKMTEEDQRKILDLELEKQERLEKGRKRQEKHRKPKDMESMEEALAKRLILAEIRENAWKRREDNKSSHEEYSDRLEKEEQKLSREKIKEKVKQKEEELKSIEKKEKDRKIQFMEAWKEKEERKRKQKKVQQGWKDLLESVEYWEELQEGETEYTDENLEEWFEEEWSEEGFEEAGTVLELVLTDVIAFIEMCGTDSQAEQQCTQLDARGQAEQSEGPSHQYGEGAPLYQINTRARGDDCQAEQQCSRRDSNQLDPAEQKCTQSDGTVPPDRREDLKKIENEIKNLEIEIKMLEKAKKNKNNVQKSSRRKSRHEKSRIGEEARKGVEPAGKNGELWKLKWNMKRMFRESKLLCGTVPKIPPIITNKFQSGAVPPAPTATPVPPKLPANSPVPPASTATISGSSRKKLLVGTIPTLSGTVMPASTATPWGARNKRRKCPSSQTSHTPIQKAEVATVTLSGKEEKDGVLQNDSKILQAGGDQHIVQKSTKEIKLKSKVSEMRKIWEQNIVSKFTDGPRISETKSICAKPMGGLEKPTVFGTSQQRW